MISETLRATLAQKESIDLSYWFRHLGGGRYRSILPKVQAFLALLEQDAFWSRHNDVEHAKRMLILSLSMLPNDLFDEYHLHALCFSAFLNKKGHWSPRWFKGLWDEHQILLKWSKLETTMEKSQLYEGQKIEHLRGMFVTVAGDVRLVWMALLRDLSELYMAKHLDLEKKTPLAKYAKNVCIPVANMLGLGQLKWQFEDLVLRYLEPETYHHIASGLDARRHEREHYVEHFRQTLVKGLNRDNVAFMVCTGRAKHIASIARKMSDKGLLLEDLCDVVAFRLLVKTKDQAYEVLSWLHAHFEMVKEEFDDYILRPKANGYQSLHTVILDGSRPIEVQIRTKAMHDWAESGVAAHWLYKEKMRLPTTEISIDGYAISSPYVYVFTPLNEIKRMKRGATILDFAYAIHTSIGHRCRGGLVDGSIDTLTSRLKNGTEVQINLHREERPSRNWIRPSMGYLQSAHARRHIVQWFRQRDRHINQQIGLQKMHQALKKMNIPHLTVEKVSKHHGLKEQELCLKLGEGKMSIEQVMHHWVVMLKKKDVSVKNYGEHPQVLMRDVPGRIDYSIAKCCRPIMGERIVGHATKRHGLRVHQSDCHHLISIPYEQKVALKWETKEGWFGIDIKIITEDYFQKSDLEDWLHTHRVKHQFKLEQRYQGLILLHVWVCHLMTLGQIIYEIGRLNGVAEVERHNG